METVTTKSGKVGHIVSGITSGFDSRTITTVCGKTFGENELRLAKNLDVCSACEKKSDVVVEDSPKAAAVEPVSEEKPAKASTEKPETTVEKKTEKSKTDEK